MPSLRWWRFSSTWIQLCLSLLALGLFAIVVIYVQATYLAAQLSAEKGAPSNFLKSDVSTTLAVVRASQGLLFALISGFLNSMFRLIQWNLSNSARGLSYHDLLALSPTTGSLGALAILRSSTMAFKSKLWLLMRVFLMAILSLSGLVLFFNTTIVTVYDTAHTYNATAGVGPFNGSLVEPFTRFLASTAPGYPHEILSFTYFAAVYILVASPLISTVATPVRCLVGSKCVFYLLSGGLEMVTPWVRPGHEQHTMVRIDNVPSVQLDFSTIPASNSNINTFREADCDDFGKTGFNIGIGICVASQPDDAGLRVGLFVCPNGTSDSTCSTSLLPSKPNISTNVSFYTRAATIIAARSNYPITSVEQTTAPVLLPASSINVPSYRQSLCWLLNYTAADIPPPSSIAQSFWSSQPQLSSGPATYGILEQNFHSIVAFPFWLFNSNNWANPDLKSDEIIDTLPAQFYTTASVVEPVVKLRFDERMFVLFVALQGASIVFVWAVLGWVWFGGCGGGGGGGGGGGRFDYEREDKEQIEPQSGYYQPKISLFPLWDIVFRSRNVGIFIDGARKDEVMAADDRQY